QWTEAKRYADQLHAAVRTLQDPAVANYFNGSWEAKGNTVEELIRNMTAQGLRFAPATQGDETAYQVLYHDLLAYDTALGQRGTPGRPDRGAHLPHHFTLSRKRGQESGVRNQESGVRGQESAKGSTPLF